MILFAWNTELMKINRCGIAIIWLIHRHQDHSHWSNVHFLDQESVIKSQHLGGFTHSTKLRLRQLQRDLIQEHLPGIVNFSFDSHTYISSLGSKIIHAFHNKKNM